MDEQQGSTPLRKYSREIIAVIVGLGIVYAATQIIGVSGFAAGMMAIILTLITPVIIYPIPTRKKVLFAILPHIVACILLLFRANPERPMDLALVWLALIGPGLMVAGTMYGMERALGRKGVGICMALAAVGLVIFFVS